MTLKTLMGLTTISLTVFLLALNFNAQAQLCSQLLKANLFLSQVPIKMLTPGQTEIGKRVVVEHKALETQNTTSIRVPVVAVEIQSGTYYILQDRHHTLNGLAINKGPDFVVDLNIVERIVDPKMSDAELISQLAREQKVYLGSETITDQWSFKKD